MNAHTRDVLKLKAAIEFGSEFIYTIKQGGLGPTLFISACELPSSHEKAIEVRKKAPCYWEDLYVIVTYLNTDEEDDLLYDPSLV